MELYSEEYIKDYLNTFKKIHHVSDAQVSSVYKYIKLLNTGNIKPSSVAKLIETFKDIASPSDYFHNNYMLGFSKRFPLISLCIAIKKVKIIDSYVLKSVYSLFQNTEIPINKIKLLISPSSLSMVQIKDIYKSLEEAKITDLGYKALETLCVNESNFNKLKLLN